MIVCASNHLTSIKFKQFPRLGLRKMPLTVVPWSLRARIRISGTQNRGAQSNQAGRMISNEFDQSKLYIILTPRILWILSLKIWQNSDLQNSTFAKKKQAKDQKEEYRFINSSHTNPRKRTQVNEPFFSYSNFIIYVLSFDPSKSQRFPFLIQLFTENQAIDFNDLGQESLPLDEQWRKQWIQKGATLTEDVLLESLNATFRNERRRAMLLHFIYYQIIGVVPILAFFIFANITNNAYNSTGNIILVSIVIVLKIAKPFVRVRAEGELRQIGVSMCNIVTRAVMEKTMKVSLLSNHSVASSELLKIMQVDIERVMNYPETRSTLLNNLYIILFTVVVIIVLFGWAGALGIVALVLSILVQFLFRKPIEKYEVNLARETSKRVQRTIDILGIIKLIKVRALEMPYFKKLVSLRDSELEALHSRIKFKSIPTLLTTVASRFVVLIVCFFLILQDKEFNTAVVFTLNFIFLGVNLTGIISGFSSQKEAKVSLQNIDKFLKTEQMNTAYIKRGAIHDGDAITVKDGNFYWDMVGEGQATRRIQLKGVQLRVKRGEFVSVIGKFGSGKTSLFSALLGEMKEAGGSSVVLNGRVAYVSQKAWIVSDTVKGNILFGAPFDPARYERALHFSCLKSDLQILSEGDRTLIGERGCTLSGGQRTRVALARALYSDADVFLLDDVLSAVDAHVGAFLFFETFSKHLKGKTVLLATHSLNYVQHTDQILILDQCTIAAKGTFDELKDHPLLREIERSEKSDGKHGGASSSILSLKQLKNQEVIEQQINDEQALSMFLDKSGGLAFQITTSFLILLTALISFFLGIWMNYWANASDYKENSYAYIYICITMLVGLCITLLYVFIMHSPILLTVYKDMLKGTLFASLNYFEVTPMAKIMHKFSTQLNELDKVVLGEFLNFAIYFGLMFCFAISIVFADISSKEYILLISFLIFLSIILYEYKKYLQAVKGYQHSEMDIRISINSFYGEMVQGQTTVRAFNKVPEKKEYFGQKLKECSKARTAVNNIDLMINFVLSFGLTLYLIIMLAFYFLEEKAINNYTVFAIFNVIRLEDFMQRANQSIMNFLVKLNCISKCEQLAKVPPEDGYRQMIKDWDEQEVYQKTTALRALSPFTRGEIEFRNVSVRYRRELGDVLKKVSFRIRGGEKIGVVGRTGSGKSTLFLTFLRVVEPHTGTILIDGRDTASVSLCALRSSVNFILQEHFLFAGTVRANVDPSQEHSDEEVKHALGLCGLWEGLQRREGLGTAVAEGGENMSAGERQLLNIARSLLARKNIVLVDEATASIDAQSDAAIQRVLSSHFRDCTVLTIAHRLNTVASSDRILVLQRGQVREFDTPANLLQQKESIYRKLCQQTSSANSL